METIKYLLCPSIVESEKKDKMYNLIQVILLVKAINKKTNAYVFKILACATARVDGLLHIMFVEVYVWSFIFLHGSNNCVYGLLIRNVFCQPKICYFGCEIISKKYVGGLKISMNDIPARPDMKIKDALCNGSNNF